MEKKYLYSFISLLVIVGVASASAYNLKGTYDIIIPDTVFNEYQDVAIDEGKTVEQKIEDAIQDQFTDLEMEINYTQVEPIRQELEEEYFKIINSYDANKYQLALEALKNINSPKAG